MGTEPLAEYFDRWYADMADSPEEAAALDPGDDPALQSFHDEGVRSLEIFGVIRRVMASPVAPGRSGR